MTRIVSCMFSVEGLYCKLKEKGNATSQHRKREAIAGSPIKVCSTAYTDHSWISYKSLHNSVLLSAIGSGPRYQILSHVFARCASFACNSRMAVCFLVSRAILAWQCVFWFRVQFLHGRVFSDSRNVQKCATQIIYLGPLPNRQYREQT